MLTGERIALRRLHAGDGDLWVEWFGDPELNGILSSGNGVPASPEGMRQAVAHLAEDSVTRVDFTVVRNDGTPIGAAHLADIDPWARYAEFGMFIGPPADRGRGVGQEIARLSVDFAFRELNLHKVWITIDVDNVASIRCCEKVGFHHDGVLRDHVFKGGRYVDRVLMSILRSEWPDPPLER
ncbi:MAG TPA: GNAT family protein [Thermomicrobiaceae bacterium]|nr:GNAT family protein [Thermomicrobiaceae bacterium]